MGILGGVGRAMTKPGKTSGLSVADRLAIFLTAANGDVATAMELRNAPIKRAELDRMRRLSGEAADLFAPPQTSVSQPPIMGQEGSDLSDAFSPQGPMMQRKALSPTEIAGRLAQLQGQGLDTRAYQGIASYAKPELANFDGQITDKATGEIMRDVPKVGEGMRRRYDANGNAVGAENLAGYADAIMQTEAAKTTGSEATRAAYDLIDVPDGNGGTIKMPRSAYLGMIGQGGAGGPGRMGYTPPAAQLSADKVVADAQAERGMSLPTDIATVDAALDSIRNLKADPSLPMRTGAWGVLPALPGTEGVGFDAQLKQLKGQVFLDAYASLKGAGAITEQEGRAATEAKSRLDSAQTGRDFITALTDLERALSAGKERLAGRAGVSAPRPQSRDQPASRPSRAALEAEARRRGLIK